MNFAEDVEYRLKKHRISKNEYFTGKPPKILSIPVQGAVLGTLIYGGYRPRADLAREALVYLISLYENTGIELELKNESGIIIPLDGEWRTDNDKFNRFRVDIQNSLGLHKDLKQALNNISKGRELNPSYYRTKTLPDIPPVEPIVEISPPVEPIAEPAPLPAEPVPTVITLVEPQAEPAPLPAEPVPTVITLVEPPPEPPPPPAEPAPPQNAPTQAPFWALTVEPPPAQEMDERNHPSANGNAEEYSITLSLLKSLGVINSDGKRAEAHENTEIKLGQDKLWAIFYDGKSIGKIGTAEIIIGLANKLGVESDEITKWRRLLPEIEEPPPEPVPPQIAKKMQTSVNGNVGGHSITPSLANLLGVINSDGKRAEAHKNPEIAKMQDNLWSIFNGSTMGGKATAKIIISLANALHVESYKITAWRRFLEESEKPPHKLVRKR